MFYSKSIITIVVFIKVTHTHEVQKNVKGLWNLFHRSSRSALGLFFKLKLESSMNPDVGFCLIAKIA